jgi:hypothetical protein
LIPLYTAIITRLQDIYVVCQYFDTRPSPATEGL